MIPAAKTYTLSTRPHETFCVLLQTDIYNGRRRVAAMTWRDGCPDRGVTLYPARIWKWFPAEAAALEFVRANEENYLSCMGGSVVVEYAK
jgi:hypothetical protein